MSFFTSADIRAIIQQCHIQRATSQAEIAGFAAAYADAKGWAIGGTAFDEGCLESNILDWAQMIYPDKNGNGYRDIWVTINGVLGPNPTLVPRMMEQFVDAVEERRLTDPAHIYKEFETIHGFVDGNGRVGMLLYLTALYYQTGEWVPQQPPDVFHEDKK